MALNGRLVDACAAAIIAEAQMLTELDQAIGDGDHGINMKRGFSALLEQRDVLDGLPLGEALMKAGMTLVTNVGGASGPLYGTLLMSLGKAAKSGLPLQEQIAAAIEALKKRGKSDIGAKTMLDVLVPVADAIAKVPVEQQCALARRTADDALEATRPMEAKRGRASFLGERSIGHLDPGGASSRILIHAVCDVLEAGA